MKLRVIVPSSPIIALMMTACSSGDEPTDVGVAADGALIPDGTANDAPPDAAPADVSNPLADASVPSIDGNARLPDLTKEQLGELCDWENAALGGYGKTTKCVNSTAENDPDQAACIANISFSSAGCSLTVTEFESCVQARVPSGGCSYPGPQCTPMTFCRLRDM